MKAINATALRDKFKEICDMAVNGETIIVSRPHNQNVVVLSETAYNKLEKAQKNAEYLIMIEKSIQELEDGKENVKTITELEAMEHE
ncbi:MAG: type II toxin-antitoxin system Phd/YefM family antitoxin [Acidaminococcales bacterium]|nr:type II toxin-antitoxin system Phd/YefM family antitoxin [Acidaminococcales bacterium]